MDKKEVMQQLKLMGFYTKDTGPLEKANVKPQGSYLGKIVWIPIGRDKYKAVVMREEGSRVYVGTPQGDRGWFQKHEVELADSKSTKDADPYYKSNTGKIYTKTELESILKNRQKDFNDSKKREEAFRREAKQLHDLGKDYKFKLEMAESERQMQNDIAESILNIKTAMTKLTNDADPLEEKAKEKLEKGGRVQVIAPNGDRCSVIKAGNGMVQSWSEKRGQWESFPLSKCKILSVDADTVSEYNAEIQRLTKKAEQLRKMGQGKSAIEVEKQIEKLGKELRDYNRDDDATEHGSVEEYGKNKMTESMPLEKDPTLAQDEEGVHDSLSMPKTKYDDEIHRLEVEYMKREDISTPEKAIKELQRKEKINKRIQELKEKRRTETKDSGFKKYRDQNNNVWELVNPQGSFWMMECIKGSRKGDTVTFRKEAVESKMESVRDCGPVFTKGTKDNSEDELKLRIQQLEHERNVDESVMGYKPDTRKDKLIEQLKKQLKEMQEKRRTQDSMEVLRLCGFATDAEEDWITMKGTPVKIEKGQSKGEAAKKFINKKSSNSNFDYDKVDNEIIRDIFGDDAWNNLEEEVGSLEQIKKECRKSYEGYSSQDYKEELQALKDERAELISNYKDNFEKPNKSDYESEEDYEVDYHTWLAAKKLVEKEKESLDKIYQATKELSEERSK